jgi:hypothetical protein
MKGLTTPLVLGIGLTTAIPAVSAQNTPGCACHKDGVLSNCTLPEPLYLGNRLRAELSQSPSAGN